MDRIFAIEGGRPYVEQGGKWYECRVTADRVDTLDVADVKPTERYNLNEVRAKCAGIQSAEQEPFKRGRRTATTSEE